MQKFLIVTADDFGLHEAVNEAVEQASEAGVLTAASLMVAAPAAADAIRRARALPHLRVGLHLVLADGSAMLAPDLIPDLADRAGRMNSRMFVNGVRFFAFPGVRRQLEAEIRAQFSAFARTGLTLDHVNVHKHFHLHPTLLEMLLRIGREYGVTAVRVPDEPLWFAARGGGFSGANAALLAPWIALMKRRLRRAQVPYNDRVFGVAASGAMDEAKLLEIIDRLPPGVTEIYLHPATLSGSAIASSMSQYRHAEELAALLSPRVRGAIAAAGIGHGGFADALRARRLQAA
ncbi:MAG TPA: hopanoid biosynthesis-associated protein HpnK [Steroidobacteraceae bacterium]|jgi:hopanoid biosynthesis associated protein HpnK